jgi:hypothetical protein
MEMDRPDFEKTKYYHKTSSVLEPSEYDNQRKTKEYTSRKNLKKNGVILVKTEESYNYWHRARGFGMKLQLA